LKLKDKVAIITGGGSGIGRVTASLFAKEGANVVLVDIDSKKGQETVRMIKNAGGEATFIEADVTKAADAERMVKEAVANYGKLDILHNNAGFWLIGSLDRVTHISEGDWDRIIDVNLKSVFLCSKYAVPEMIRNGGGIIINTASEAGLVGYPDSAAYCAAKGGVVLLTRQMALDYAPVNIRVNCICPANVLTPLMERYLATLDHPEQTRQAIEQVMPLGRFCTPEEVAYGALYLASDESSFTTGTALVIDGGVTSGGTHTYPKI